MLHQQLNRGGLFIIQTLTADANAVINKWDIVLPTDWMSVGKFSKP